MALTTTTRSTPVGVPLDDGYSTKIALANDPDISFWEKTVKPPGLDGGDAIDTTTMHNSTYRTFASRALSTMTDITITAAWDPQCYDSVLAQINVEQSITVHFPNGDRLDLYGFLRTFEPQDHVEGTHPEVNLTITPTNQDPTTRAETAADWLDSGSPDN